MQVFKYIIYRQYMENHTVHSYDSELNQLRSSVVSMANLVKDLMDIAKQAIENPDKSFVEIADKTDQKINFFDEQIEYLAIHVIALRQPMAIDLRQVIAALKLAVILERMGDLAKKISYRTEYLPITLKDELISLMNIMILNLERLMNDVIKAYSKLDEDLAKKIVKEDDLIDEYYYKLIEFLEQEIENMPSETKHFLGILLVVRNLERIGDYISKIANITLYIITGKSSDI